MRLLFNTTFDFIRWTGRNDFEPMERPKDGIVRFENVKNKSQFEDLKKYLPIPKFPIR